MRQARKKGRTYGADYFSGLVDDRYCLHERHLEGLILIYCCSKSSFERCVVCSWNSFVRSLKLR